MAHTYTNIRPSAFSVRSALTLGGLVTRVASWNEARRTRAALSRLSAHELEDIGLTRGDIDVIAGTRY